MKSLHRSVLILSLVSFFTDFSSEMIYPLLPIYLVTVLGSTPAILGLIEGSAEAIASLFKLVSGYVSDKSQKRKPLVVFGYSVSSAARPLIGIAGSWPAVFALRFIDRIGKGLRTSPRDALLADVTPNEVRGRAYGFHRSMDHWGAVIGPLTATVLLLIPGMKMSYVFLLASVPAIIAVGLLIFGLKEDTKTKSIEPITKTHPFKDWRHFDTNFKVLMLAIFIFALGQSTDAFLLLRLKEVGIPDFYIPTLWALLHIIKATSSQYLGRLSDKIGYRPMITFGWIYYALIYIGFAFINIPWAQIVLFFAYGLYFGMVEAPEKAWISTLAPKGLQGSAFGFYHMIVGLAALPASIIFGLIWTHWNASYAFLFGALISFLALGLVQLTQFRRG